MTMIELTKQQKQQLEDGKAVEVSDLETNKRYVLLKKEVYERASHLVFDDSDWTQDELRLLLARSAKDNGWEEAGMSAYDRYEQEQVKRWRGSITSNY
jgi:hypothetical protein